MDWLKRKDKLGQEIIKDLYENKMILTWFRDNPKGWKLHSGKWSPFYIQLREISAFPNILKKVGSALSELIKQEIPHTNLIIGLAMAGIPISTAISIQGNIPSAFTRKLEGDFSNFEELINSYGQHSLVEGRLNEEDNIVLVDDLVTYFTSKLQGIQILQHEARKRKVKINVNHILVLLDREQGGLEEAQKNNLELHRLIPFKTQGIHWLKDSLDLFEYETIKDYLNDPEQYQNEGLQETLFKASSKNR